MKKFIKILLISTIVPIGVAFGQASCNLTERWEFPLGDDFTIRESKWQCSNGCYYTTTSIIYNIDLPFYETQALMILEDSSYCP